MKKRRISKQQKARIEAIQARRREHVKATITGDHTGLLIAHYGKTVDVEMADDSILQCRLRQNIEALAPGDRVVCDRQADGVPVVVAMEPRRSLLARITGKKIKPLAANVDNLLITITYKPAFLEELIDRYLVAAEHLHLQAIIVFNKLDRVTADQLSHIQSRLACYQTIGYPILYVSAQTRDGFIALEKTIANHTNVFVGQSGVGKSSLINSLLPESTIAVGEITEHLGLGRHTTTTARLYHLPHGGDVIDSPGVREFTMPPLTSDQIFEGFIEFLPYKGHCKFRDCQHKNDLGCAIIEAVKAGAINKRRYESYLALGQSS